MIRTTIYRFKMTVSYLLLSLIAIVVCYFFTVKHQSPCLNPHFHVPNIDRDWSQNYLITGGAGFIGSHVIDKLLDQWSERQSYRIVMLDNFSDYYSPILKQRNVDFLTDRYPMRVLDGSLVIIRGSINDECLVAAIFTRLRVTHVVHLAASPGVRVPIQHHSISLTTNVGGTQKLLEQSVRHNISMFVFASSSSVYGRSQVVPFKETDPCDRPLSPYAAAKRAGEILSYAYHNLYSLNVTILRLFNVYGPRGRPDMMPARLLLASTDSAQTLEIFNDGAMMRDWTYIDDVVSGFVKALAHPFGYQIFNIGYGHPVNMSTFIHHIEQISGNAKIRSHIRLAKSQASEPLITYADINKANRLLQFFPTVSLATGLNRTWHWFIREPSPFKA